MLIDTTRPVERTNGTSYCGPLVVAAICGTSTGQVETEIFARRRNGLSHKGARRSGVLRRTREPELIAVLSDHGYKAESVPCGARLTALRRNVFINEAFTRWNRVEPLFSAERWLPASLLRTESLLLWQWRNARCTDKAATYIINTPGHWALYSAGLWCETFTKGAWVDARIAPGQRRRVLNAYLVTKGA